jgi:copper(I)-binding protein
MRERTPIFVIAVLVLLASGCTQASDHDAHRMADGVSLTDQWATAGDMGMAAMFGTLVNSGHHDARIVSGSSPAAGRVEVHEVVADASGTKAMRPKSGGFLVPAGGTHELAPGGDHLMLIDLTQPLLPGTDVSMTLAFEDGSTLAVSAQIRDFAGGDEHYEPSPATPHDHG